MRWRVVTGTYRYPADAASLAIAQGRVSQLTPAEAAQVRWTTVTVGDWCDDMPPASAAVYLSRGWIEAVPDEALPAKGRR